MTYVRDFFEFIKKQADQGGAELRMVATIDPDTGSITAYAHPLNKNGDTFDFMLADIGGEVQIMSNPNITQSHAKAALPDQAEPILQFFGYQHLPDHLKKVSAPFALLALDIVSMVPRNPERTVALRKLLEAKDCAVRAMIYK